MLRIICISVVAALAFAVVPALAQPEPEMLRHLQRVKVIETSDPARPIFEADEEDCGVNLLLCGEIAQSTLTTRDCKVESNGTFFDLWFFAGYRGDLVAAGAISDDFDTLLAMYTPTPTVWDVDSAPAGEPVAVASFLPSTGVWGLSVGSLSTSPAKTGDYFVHLSCGSSNKCKANSTTLCLGNGRYRVQVGYHNQFAGRYGFGGAILPGRSTESGYFYFGSDPSNIELMVKILDFGDAVKVFWGQLTNLQYKIVVTDLARNTAKTYLSPTNNCGGNDANAFASSVAAQPSREAACRAGKNTACLLKGRFQVEGTWRNQFNGTSGSMGASRVSDLTSAFFFGSPGNVELLVKVADLGNRIGLFYGAMSNLEYTLTVRDTLTGEVKTYSNPAGNYCGGQADLPK